MFLSFVPQTILQLLPPNTHTPVDTIPSGLAGSGDSAGSDSSDAIIVE